MQDDGNTDLADTQYVLFNVIAAFIVVVEFLRAPLNGPPDIPAFLAVLTGASAAAGVIGLGHRKGRIAPGFDADILAVDGDPIADPGALHRIRAVYARGAAVPGEAPGPR